MNDPQSLFWYSCFDQSSLLILILQSYINKYCAMMHLNLIKTDGMFIVMLNHGVWQHVLDLSLNTAT